MQYLGGCCFRKIYLKIRKSKFWSTEATQQSLEILKVAKVETDNSQILANSENCGGLWMLNNNAQHIFIVSEKVFCEATRDFARKIDSHVIVSKVLHEIQVEYHFKQKCANTSMKVDKEIAKNLLENPITLYIRVRSHSFAKLVREKHKAASKGRGKRSLRTEIRKQVVARI